MVEMEFRALDRETNTWVYFTMKQLLSHYDTDQLHSDKESLAGIDRSTIEQVQQESL